MALAAEKPKAKGPVADVLTRVKLFLGIQAFFLVVSVFTVLKWIYEH